MTNSRQQCSEGRDPSQLLAYVEGDLDAAACHELESHLRSCSFCASECEALRKADRLLRTHREAFHPDEEELYRFVATGEDIGQRIASHLASCRECSEDAELLRQMLRAGSEIPAQAPELPKSLIRELEQLHPLPTSPGVLGRLHSSVTELMRLPFQMPVLALGTAAAVVFFVIVSIPLWDTFNKIEHIAPGVAEQQLAPERKKSDSLDLERSGEATLQRAPVGSFGVGPMEERIQEPAASPPAKSELPAASESHRFERPKKAQPERMPLAAGKAVPAVPAPRQERYSTDTMLPSAPPVFQERKGDDAHRTPRMAYPKADHAKMREARKAEVPEFPREAPPASTALGSGLADSRIPLSVRVTDAEGRPISWLYFSLPTNLAGRYRLVPEVDAEKQISAGTAVPEDVSKLAFQNKFNGATRITVVVRERNGVFDVEAKLFEPGSAVDGKKIDAIGVAKGDMAVRVASLVASLLNTGQ